MYRHKPRPIFTHKKQQFNNKDLNKLNKCTFCDFNTHFKDTFRHHLMKMHGIKLASLEEGQNFTNTNSYGFGIKRPLTHTCTQCFKSFPSDFDLQAHLKSHETKNFSGNEKVYKSSDDEKEYKCSDGWKGYKCPDCDKVFMRQKKFRLHVEACGKGTISCQLCNYQTTSMSKIQVHFIDFHNLICEPVEEADFEQVLNNTPYILRRPIICESLEQSVNTTTKKIKNSFLCTKCNREFTKLRYVEEHRNKNIC